MKAANLICTMVLAMSSLAWAGMEEDVARIRQEWERVKYQVPAKEQEAAFEALAKDSEKLVAQYPKQAEPAIWHGIIEASHAGAKGGLGALDLVKQAKSELEQALKLDAKALDGSAYTSLGSLYYQVPGWPIAFGDDEKAEAMLKTALSLNPNGIDPNYFYGDFLVRKKRYQEAKVVLEKALAAADRPARASADAGRREEARKLLKTVQAKLE